MKSIYVLLFAILLIIGWSSGVLSDLPLFKSLTGTSQTFSVGCMVYSNEANHEYFFFGGFTSAEKDCFGMPITYALFKDWLGKPIMKVNAYQGSSFSILNRTFMMVSICTALGTITLQWN